MCASVSFGPGPNREVPVEKGPPWATLAGICSFLQTSPAGPEVASGPAAGSPSATSPADFISPALCRLHQELHALKSNAQFSACILLVPVATCDTPCGHPYLVQPLSPPGFQDTDPLSFPPLPHQWLLLRPLGCFLLSPSPQNLGAHTGPSSSPAPLAPLVTQARGFQFHLCVVPKTLKGPPAQPSPTLRLRIPLLSLPFQQASPPRVPERSLCSRLSEYSSGLPLLRSQDSAAATVPLSSRPLQTGPFLTTSTTGPSPPPPSAGLPSRSGPHTDHIL